MPSGATFRRKWRMMPDRANVTYRSQTSLGNYSNSTVTETWWRPGGSGEAAPSFGVYVRASRSWYIPKEVFANAPNVGDLVINTATTIDPTATTWTVLGVSDEGALGAWVCESLSLELQGNLTQTANISRPTLAQDSAYRQALTNYTAVATSVPVRLQPEESVSEDALGRRTLVKNFTLYLEPFVDVQAKDVVTVSGGNYTVLSTRNQRRIDELQAIPVEYVS